MLSIDGLVTGIDTSSIIEGLLSIRQSQIDQLASRQQEIVAKQTAFAGVEARLIDLQNQADRLGQIHNSVFEAKFVTSSDESILKGAATDDAAVGIYNLTVNSLAQAHQIATQGFDAAESLITQGTLDIRVGNAPTTTITVDATNNTLQGLAESINTADAGVTASVIFDGSAGSTPYRLLLTAGKTGAANEIAITNNLGATGGGATQPSFQLSPPVQAATDASISLGSGPGAITISSESNQIDNVIPGVTLDLLAADAGKSISVRVESDVEAGVAAVRDFVDSFDGLMQYIDDQVRYDAETEQASLLLGERSVITIQDDVRRAVTEVVAGVSTEMNRLSSIGISVNSAGQLTFNESELRDVLSGNVDGVGPADVRRLFSLDGQSDHANVRFVFGSANTQETATGYQIDITQAAERARITATSTLAASTVIDSSNNEISITIDGIESSVLTLEAGTYTRTEIAEHLQDLIEADPKLVGRGVEVTLDADALRITSDAYGAASEVTIGSGSALASLGFDGTETDNGLNVAGKFIVGGVDELATGKGQLLAGVADSENTADLEVRVTLSAAQVVAGPEATMTISRGIGSRLKLLTDSLLDPINGRVETVNDGFEDNVASIQESIDRLNEQFEAEQERLVRQFVALETAVSDLQATGNFLAAQLAGISNFAPQ